MDTLSKTVVEYLYEHAVNTPDSIAVVDANGKVSYSELWRLVSSYSEFLKSKGIKKGDIVVARGSQDLRHVVCYLAIHLAGGIAAMTEAGIPAVGLMDIAGRTKAKAVITKEDCPDTGLICLNSVSVLEDAAGTAPADNPVFPLTADCGDILFTTGTTGKSKGVLISHRALTATAENIALGCGYKHDTVIITPGPLNHASGTRKILTTVFNGSTIYILNGMTNVKAFFDALEYKEGTLACCLPPASIQLLLKLTGDKIGNYSNVIDFIESSSSPLPEPVRERLCRLLPDSRLYNHYALSEAGAVTMYDYNSDKRPAGCIGREMKNARVIVDESADKDNPGILSVAGAITMEGYLYEPELTAKTLNNGVVLTSDLGYRDKDGYVYICGRKDDVINVGGLKVAPTEIEELILSFPGINDCICIPVDDEITGKAVKALLVTDSGELPDLKALSSYLKKNTEFYKVPKKYELTDKVARTYNGKINRKFYLQ